jgi:hypothetical protein
MGGGSDNELFTAEQLMQQIHAADVVTQSTDEFGFVQFENDEEEEGEDSDDGNY